MSKGAIASYISQESQQTFDLGGLPERDEYEYGLRLRTADEIFVQDFFFEGESFAQREDVIPVIVPREWLANRVMGEEAIVEMSQQEMYELGLSLKDEYSAKEVLLQDEAAGDTGVIVRVVGFAPGGLFDNMNLSGVMIIPTWALENEMVTESSNVIHEFSTKEARDAYFGEANTDQARQTFTMPLMARYEFFEAFIRIARGVGLGIGGFLLFVALLFILINVSKAVADSRKEIGVFRAVGATKWDIQKIYFAFAGIIVNLGFIMALIVAVVVNGLVSWKWGSDLFYRLMNMGTVVDVDKPMFLFIHIGPAIIVLYVVVFALALLAAAIPAARAAKIDPVVALKD